MNYRIFLFFVFLSLPSIGQNGYVFRSDGVQLTFPRKPSVDTTTTLGGFKVRVVLSKDSLSNYYLNTTERLVVDPQDEVNKKNLGAYMDGFMDSIREKYKAEMLSKTQLRVNSDTIGDYYMKGYYGQTPVYIRSWVCLKGSKTIVCQHIYAIPHEAVLRPKQQAFFQSLIL